jgi:hypothetical protein
MHNKNIQNWGNFPKINYDALETSSYSDIKGFDTQKIYAYFPWEWPKLHLQII